jgi:hypothetical protein
MDFTGLSLPLDPQEEELSSLQTHFLNNYDVLEAEFLTFQTKCINLLELAFEKLTEKIDTDPVTLQEALLTNMSLHYSLGVSTADAKTYQQIYEILHYCPKKQKYSEADRKLYTGTKTLKQSNLVAQLKNAEDKMEKRITVLQSVLKSETARIRGQEAIGG